MPEELGNIVKFLNNVQTKKFGDLIIYNGEWIPENNDDIKIIVSLAWSGWGK